MAESAAMTPNNVSEMSVHAGLARDLHDLCQPLTTLQCQLELGQMVGGEDALREAVDGALLECARMFENIRAMRERLGREKVADGQALLRNSVVSTDNNKDERGDATGEADELGC